MTILSAMPDDTVQACRDRSTTGDMIGAYLAAAYYVNGMGKPHFGMPAIRFECEFVEHTDYGILGRIAILERVRPGYLILRRVFE